MNPNKNWVACRWSEVVRVNVDVHRVEIASEFSVWGFKCEVDLREAGALKGERRLATDN